MKKKIFTLLCFCLLAAGTNVAKAEEGKPWNLQWDTVAINRGAIYEGCTNEIVIGVRPGTNRVIKFDMSNVAHDKNGSCYIVDAETNLPFPDSMLVAGTDTTTIFLSYIHKTLGAPDDTKEDGYTGTFGITVNGSFGSYSADKNYTFYNHPTVDFTYTPATPNYRGALSISWKGGIDTVFWSVDNGETWRLRGNDVLTPTEIANLATNSSVHVREPNGCGVIPIFKADSSISSGPARPITFNNVENASIQYAGQNAGQNIQGITYVNSGSSFSFVIVPTGANAELVPVVSTNRTDPSDEIGVVVTPNSDGSYTATIRGIRTPINVSISFTTGTIEAGSSKIWSNNGRLYLTSVKSGKANIYSVNGMLYHTISFSAGETSSIGLPAGIYVISVNNGKGYKVAVQ